MSKVATIMQWLKRIVLSMMLSDVETMSDNPMAPPI